MLEALRECGKDLGDGELQRLAADILLQVREDREVLERLIRKVGSPDLLKEGTAWLAQKLARFKLPGSHATPLGLFETLEAVALGILGKRALWEALSKAAYHDERLAGVDYGNLIQRAHQQFDLINQRRLSMVGEALRGGASSGRSQGPP
jgi:hypothetical protein